jgi:hypothetical protein
MVANSNHEATFERVMLATTVRSSPTGYLNDYRQDSTRPHTCSE